MKRQGLTLEELEKVIRLKKGGTSWLKIQHETGINRRTAKRAYEKWEQTKSTGELSKARQDVAAQAFSEHINNLIKLAGSLVGALCVPERLRVLGNADEALDRFWITNILELERSSTSESVSHGREHVVWRNKMLFKSLQEHTRDKVRWQALEEWEEARNSAVKHSKELRLKATEVIRNNLNNCLGLEKRIKTAIGDNDVIEKIADGVIENIWRGTLTGNREEIHVVKGASVTREGQVWLTFYESDSETRFYLNDVELAKEVLSMCRQVVTNLREGTESDLVRKLADEVSQMQARTKELEEGLDELLLRPMILLTRCDLCPA